MNNRKLYFTVALIITLVVLILLATGSSLLNLALDKKNTIPLGTFITWAGLMALPLSIYWGIAELRKSSNALNIFLSLVLKTIIVLAILWVPISYLPAGNFPYSFTEKITFQGGQQAMRWFWRLTYAIPVGAITVLIIYWITSYVLKLKKNLKNKVSAK